MNPKRASPPYRATEFPNLRVVAEKRGYVQDVLGDVEALGCSRGRGHLPLERGSLAPPPAPALAAEAGRDHGHLDVAAHRVVDHGPEDDVRVLIRGARDDLRRL